MHLVKFDDKALSQLPTDGARSYVKDKYAGRTIRMMDAEQLVDSVMDIISKGHRNLGHTTEARDKGQITHTAKQVISAILNAKEFKKGRTTYDLRNVTIEELDKSVSELTLGSYKKKPDEVVIVSASTILYGLECYLTEPSRIAALNYHQLLLDTPVKKAEPSKEEQEYIIQKGLEYAIEKFKKEGEFPPASSCHVFYRHMKKRGELNLTEEEKADYLSKARVICEANLKQTRGAMTPAEYKEAFSKIGDNGNSVKLKAMELAFKDYLNKLKG